jgi:hypothetical protein
LESVAVGAGALLPEENMACTMGVIYHKGYSDWSKRSAVI